MGYKTQNIIAIYERKKDDALLEIIPNLFPYTQAKLFEAGFQGLIGQLDENQCYHECEILEQYEKYQVKDIDELFERIEVFRDKVIEISILFPEKTFAYIEVDCFGGTCLYEGLVVKNKEIVFQQHPDKSGHISILQKLHPAYSEFYFEPFTRDFFKKKGEISGFIQDFSIAGLWLLLKTDYPDKKKYYVDGSANSLILRRQEAFYFYFKAKDKREISVTGVIYDDSSEMIQEIEQIIQDSFQGFQYQIQIQEFKNNTNIFYTSK